MRQSKNKKPAHLPPAVAVKIILLDDLYPLSRVEGDLVVVFGEEVMQSIDILWHIALT